MRFGILGPLEVAVGPTRVDVRRGIPRTLLIALLLQVGDTVSVSSLMELLWGDRQPQNPANALQIQVSYLRRLFSAAEEGGSRLIVTRSGGYALEVDPEQIDARRFERLVRDAAAMRSATDPAHHEAALAQLDAALSLWRGDALADVADHTFVAGEITRLEEARWAAVEARNDVLLALGHHQDLVGELHQLVNRHPLREHLHEQLMLALYRSGRQADALRAFEQARTTLVEELGLDPGPGLRDLELAVLAQDPRLDWRPPVPSAASTLIPRAAGAGRLASPLPSPITRLVGREAELARARDLLNRTRILTLTGPGGAGKSRLALEVARAEAVATQVWFVDLSSITRDDRVAATVAAAVGVPSAPDEDTVSVIANALSLEQGLLFLDTCERVLAGVSETASQVLRLCPGIRVLATSRRPMGMTGEIAWPVPPLALPPPRSATAAEVGSSAAVALFCERAAAVRAGFALSDANAGDVAAICLALDGLPLAIELAAARSDVLTPAAIRARLQNRFELLIEGGRDAAARQQTLKSALDWSFELLEPDQRRFFARLGVFAGSFSLDAAASVAGHGFRDPLSLLSALVRHSLVTVVGDDRYRLLDTLRAYALVLLEDADEGTALRHAGHYTALAEAAEPRIVGPDQMVWLDALRADVPNLRAAIEWSSTHGEHELAGRLAGALGWFWALEGMLDEAIRYLEQATSGSSIPTPVRSKALWALALHAASLGRLDQARCAGAESAALACAAGDDVGCARGLNALAVAEWALGDLDAAARAHDEAIARLQSTNDLWGLGVCMSLRARTAVDAGDPAGERMARAALPVARASGDRHVIGIALEQVAQLELAAGHTGAAVDAGRECLAMHKAVGYTEGTVAALHVLARAHVAAGQTRQARDLHLQALSLATRIGHAAAVCEALEGLGSLAFTEGDFSEAVRLLEVARRQRHDQNLPLRAPDRRVLDDLRGAAERAVGRDDVATLNAATAWMPIEAILAELLAQPQSQEGVTGATDPGSPDDTSSKRGDRHRRPADAGLRAPG